MFYFQDWPMEPASGDENQIKATGDLKEPPESATRSNQSNSSSTSTRIQLFDDAFLGKYIPSLKEDPRWADVVPVPQNDGVHSIAKINYSGQFLQSGEAFLKKRLQGSC